MRHTTSGVSLYGEMTLGRAKLGYIEWDTLIFGVSLYGKKTLLPILVGWIGLDIPYFGVFLYVKKTPHKILVIGDILYFVFPYIGKKHL